MWVATPKCIDAVSNNEYDTRGKKAQGDGDNRIGTSLHHPPKSTLHVHTHIHTPSEREREANRHDMSTENIVASGRNNGERITLSRRHY